MKEFLESELLKKKKVIRFTDNKNRLDIFFQYLQKNKTKFYIKKFDIECIADKCVIKVEYYKD
jgi:hypothetical protein